MFLKNPEWVKPFLYNYRSAVQIPDEVFYQINSDLDAVCSKKPIVSVVIPAWNEELNILACIASLAQSKTFVPFEIIVVNNNSTDRTQDIIDKLHVNAFFQSIPGTGPARQLGQEKALGDYILTADADCIYPETWVQVMYENLIKKDVVCVYGRYSFLGDVITPRWQLAIYEILKIMVMEIRHIKRPYLNTYTLSMGYLKKYGLGIGFDMRGIRGEDGRFTFDLMQYGKVRQVRSEKVVIWTGQRTLRQDGSLIKAFKKRAFKELSRVFTYLYPKAPHDTKTSKN